MLFEHLIVHIHFILDLILNIAKALMNRTILKPALYKYIYVSIYLYLTITLKLICKFVKIYFQSIYSDSETLGFGSMQGFNLVPVLRKYVVSGSLRCGGIRYIKKYFTHEAASLACHVGGNQINYFN